MGLFDGNKRNKYIDSLSKQELINETEEKKQLVEQLKDEINATKEEIKQVTNNHETTVKKLDKEQDIFYENILRDKEKIDAELNKIENKLKKSKEQYETKREKNNSKITELKQKKKELLNQKFSLDKKEFEKKKTSIENQLAELREKNKKQEKDFLEKSSSLKSEHESLLEKKKTEQTKINRLKKELSSSTDSKINELQDEAESIKKKHQNNLKQLADNHKEMISRIKSEEEKQINNYKKELSDLHIHADSLTALRDNLIKELDTTKIRCEQEIKALSSNHETEKSKLIKEFDLLKNKLNICQGEFEKQSRIEKSEYENKINEINYVSGLLGDQEANSKKQIIVLDEKIKEKYDKYFNDLEVEYNKQKQKLNEELETLKSSLEQEELQLKKKNEFLNDRYKKQCEQCKNIIDDYSRQVEETQKSLDSFEDECDKRIADFSNNIERIKNNNAIAIEQVTAKYNSIIDETKNDFSNRRQDINQQISKTKLDIENLNADIQKTKQDLNDYIEDYNNKKTVFISDHESYINNLTNRIEETKKSIDNLSNISKDNHNKHLAAINELANRKNDITKEYNQKIAKLKENYQAKNIELNDANSKKIIELKADYDEKVALLHENFQKSVEKANANYENNVNVYNAEKAKIDENIINIKIDTENQIKQLQEQKEGIINSISSMKDVLSRQQIDYDEQVKVIESEHISFLEKLAKQQEDNLASITSEYEKIPSQELSAVRKEYDIKQREYSDCLADTTLKKQNIDKEYENFVNERNTEKSKADAELEVANREYDRAKTEFEQVESSYAAELSRRENELQDYKDELSRLVQEAKDITNKKNEEEARKLNEEYSRIEKDYKEKQDALSRQYDEEIKKQRDVLQAKNENIESLISEIKERRNTIENEYIAKYNVAADSTKHVQEELDDLVNKNNLKRAELTASLDQKKKDNDTEIENLKNKYEDILKEKKKSYDDYIGEVRNKCNSLKKEIAEMEKNRQLELSKYERYAKEKRVSMESLEKETRGHLSNVSSQINFLSTQQKNLTDAHKERIATIKKQIALTMSEYDDLLKTKNQLLNDASIDNENILTEQTKIFKEKINSLEESHSLILAGLLDKRNKVLDSIAAEIEQIDIDKPNKLKEYEDEISELSNVYGTMIKEEEIKLSNVKDLVAKAQEDFEILVKETKAKGDELQIGYIQTKEALLSKNKKSLQEATANYIEVSANLKKELDKLMFDKNLLSMRLASYSSMRNDIDKEIFSGLSELKGKCMESILDLRRDLEQKRQEEQMTLSALDTLSGNNDSIF